MAYEIDVTGEEAAFLALLKLANMTVRDRMQDPEVQQLTLEAASLIGKLTAARTNEPESNALAPQSSREDN